MSFLEFFVFRAKESKTVIANGIARIEILFMRGFAR